MSTSIFHADIPARCAAQAHQPTVGTRASVLRPSQGWMRWMYMKGTDGWVKNSVDGWPLPAPKAPQNRKGPPPSDLACLPTLAGGRLGSHRRAHMTSRRLISSILSTHPSPRPAGCPPSVRSELHELDVPARL